jgi:hypothetical protein
MRRRTRRIICSLHIMNTNTNPLDKSPNPDEGKTFQQIVLYGSVEDRLVFLDQLAIERGHLDEEIDRMAAEVVENTEEHEFYLHLWYRLILADQLIKKGRANYGEVADLIKNRVNNISEDIFDEVWAEVAKRAGN